MKPTHLTSVKRGQYRDDWGTPSEIIDFVRCIFGRIDIDLASNVEAQKIVMARRWYSKINPCPEFVNQELMEIPRPRIVWCNPPGPSSRVVRFWDTFKNLVDNHDSFGAFLLFSIDHLRMIDPPKYGKSYIVPIRKRIKFVGAKSTASISSALIICGIDHLTAIKLDSDGHMGRWLKWVS